MNITYKFILSLTLLLTFCSLSIAQHHGCGTDELSKKLWITNPSIKQKQLQADAKILTHRQSQHKGKIAGVEEYIIPVVVHIIHQNGTENISDAQVQAGIEHLNQAFANEGSYRNAKGVETGIKFCLAKQDELGNVTSGITRTVSSLSNMTSPSQDLALKNLIRWNPLKYVNIWLVNEITSESSGPSVAGYAYFPSAHGMEIDGIVNEARWFGSSADNSTVHIHEFGHYLGLYHTFEGACNNNNCETDGDRVCDTPPDGSTAATLCNVPMNTCSTDANDPTTKNPYRTVALGGLGDQEDLITNHMDYGYNECKNAFTPGQKERMLSSITLIRESLLKSKGCKDPCPNPIDIAFNASDNSVQTGSNVQFTNTTTGATNYQWRVNGTQFSNATNPTYQFAQQGRFNVVLIATNGNNDCTVKDSILIEVTCSAKAAFDGLQRIKPGETVSFTNKTTVAISYQWLLDGIQVATSKDFSHTFSSAGGFTISLVIFNGTCYDTLNKFIEVGDCYPGKQGDTWYFGYLAGIKFANGKAVGTPLPENNYTNTMQATEACVSMSDVNGNFIFYANPEYVFNKNYTFMPNGTGLLGGNSATQMAVVQNPGNSNRYYLFTLDHNGGPDGLRYSEIDMTLDGGLGDIISATKNTFLTGPVTEKIITVKHSNGIDTWVIVHKHNSNEFLSYLVSSAGISVTPVISAVGTIHEDIGNGQGSSGTAGQLKASANGCRLALAISQINLVELFDMNSSTGIISNPFSLTFPETTYSIEFSPNGSMLYANSGANIYQLNLNQGYSQILVGTSSNPTGLQIGPYGKIYVAKAFSNVGVINNPNTPGLNCNFLSDAIDLGGSYCLFSLPSFNQSYFYDSSPTISGPDKVCADSKNIVYSISGSICSASNVVYTLLGDAVIASSNATEVRINFKQEGTATLIVERNAACGKTYDSLLIVIKNSPTRSLRDTTQCTNTNILLDAGSGFTSYLWQDNSSAQTYTATVPGKYWVKLSNGIGCEITDTVNVFPKQVPIVDLGKDILTCSGQIIILDAGVSAKYDWQDHFPERTYSVYLPGKYWVTVTDQCLASASDTILITHDDSSFVDLGRDTSICDGETIVLNAGKGFKNYTWQDGSTSPTYSASSPGQYTVITTNKQGCKSIGKLFISESINCCNSNEIPNLVTLNGDGLNDTFAIPCADQKWSLEIYNRWGDIIYNIKEYKNEWPNTNIDNGVYYFIIKKENKTYRGWVEVVR